MKKKSMSLWMILLGTATIGCIVFAVYLLTQPAAATGAVKAAAGTPTAELSTQVENPPQEEEPAPIDLENTGVVNTSVPFRAEPAFSCTTVMGIFESGQKVEILDVANGWVKVRVGGVEGYLSQRSVHLPPAWAEKVKDSLEPEPEIGTISGTSVRLRERPDINSAILMDMDRGDRVSILSTEGDWCHVTFGEVDGYVFARFVTTSNLEQVEAVEEEEVEITAVLPSGSTGRVKAVGLVTGDSVRIRSDANTDASIIANVTHGTAVALLDVKGSWYKVLYNGSTGYMSADYVQAKLTASDLNAYGIITTDELNVRAGSNSGTDVVTTVKKDTCVSVTGFDKGWFAITTGEKSGYISGDYMTLTMEKPKTTAQEETPQETQAETPVETVEVPQEEVVTPPSQIPTGTAAEVINFAKQYLGVPYVYGGAGPSGFDCSGFTMYVFNNFGISLPHGATPQANYGTAIAKSDLIPGDLVFFASSSAWIGHVGIYIGDGEFIHASSGSSYCVKISSLSESYYTRMYQCARRIL